MSEEEFTLNESLLLIADELLGVRGLERTGRTEHAISSLKTAKDMIDETIEDIKDEN